MYIFEVIKTKHLSRRRLGHLEKKPKLYEHYTEGKKCTTHVSHIIYLHMYGRTYYIKNYKK